jgi:hypothetical protein
VAKGTNKKLKISQSFDVNSPYMPGGQDYKGIPNASPEMLRRLQKKKIKNPGGQSLPPVRKAKAKTKKKKSYG